MKVITKFKTLKSRPQTNVLCVGNRLKIKPYICGNFIGRAKIIIHYCSLDIHACCIHNRPCAKLCADRIKRDHRTVYKYLNLCYMSPRIINTIMEGNAPTRIKLQTLFDIASKYEKFQEQEIEFYK